MVSEAETTTEDEGAAAPETPPEEPEQQRALVPSTQAAAEIRELYTWGKMMRLSGFFKDVQSEAAAAVKIMMGRALGFDMIQSMTGLHIVEGRPTIGANLMAVAVKRGGKYDYLVSAHTDDLCAVKFFAIGEGLDSEGKAVITRTEIGESVFTMEDAARAHLVKPNSGWDKFPRNMLFARALSNGVRWYCPDVFGGTAVYTPEELRPDMQITEDGEPVYIDAHFIPEAVPEGAAAQQPATAGQQQASGAARGRSRRAEPQGAPARAQTGQTAKAQDSTTAAKRGGRTKMGPDDLQRVVDVQTLNTWAYEAYGKMQADIWPVLEVENISGITAKYTSPEDYHEAALELMREWDAGRYTRLMNDMIGTEPAADVDAEDAAAQSDYESDEAGPEDAQATTVEVTEDGTILVEGEPAEPLP